MVSSWAVLSARCCGGPGNSDLRVGRCGSRRSVSGFGVEGSQDSLLGICTRCGLEAVLSRTPAPGARLQEPNHPGLAACAS